MRYLWDIIALLVLWIWIFSLIKQGLIPASLGYFVMFAYILFRIMGRIVGGEFGRLARKSTFWITIASLLTMLIVLGYGGYKNIGSLFIEFAIYFIIFAIIYSVVVNLLSKRRT